jgi:phage terminase small subunit
VSKRKKKTGEPASTRPKPPGATAEGAALARKAHMESAKEKRFRFFTEYKRCGNFAIAAKRAGYCLERPDLASDMGRKLAQYEDVQQWIAEWKIEVAERYKLDEARIKEELTRLAYTNMSHFVRVTENGDVVTDFSEVDENHLAAVQEITVETYTERFVAEDGEVEHEEVKKVKFKLHPKTGTLELLGKHFRMFADRQQHEFTNPDGSPIAPPSLKIEFIKSKPKKEG